MTIIYTFKVLKWIGRNNSDSDPAIDITEEYETPSPEERILRTVDRAKSYLQSGKVLEAKELARNVYQKLTDEDVNTFDEIIKVFQEVSLYLSR